MTEKEIKECLDQVYAVGFKNGQIEMKSKILKSLNRDWKLFGTFPEATLLIKILKKINRLKLSIEARLPTKNNRDE